MRKKIKILVLVAAMVAATSLLLPAEAYAQHYYGHGYGYGGYGPNRYSNDGAVRIEVDPKKSVRKFKFMWTRGTPVS